MAKRCCRPFRRRTSAGVCLLVWVAGWVLVNISVFVHRNFLAEYCTDQKSKGMIGRLCHNYQQGVLTGDLCEDLCVTHTMVYKRCLHYDKGKKVIQTDWNGMPIILKSKLEDFLSYDSLYLLGEQENSSILDLDILVFTALEIKHSLGLEVKNITGPELWTKHFKDRRGSLSRAEIASMWSLLQQEEYVFFQLLQDLSKHVLKMVGSCGHFYAVEYLPAGHTWHHSLFALEGLSSWRGSSSRALWQATNGIALSFLDLARHFENDFSYQLHLCDIKPENFAIRADLTVVAIDVDMAFFEPKMRDILEQNCTNDEDCNFFDCFSQCNLKTKRCRAERSNNNLQKLYASEGVREDGSIESFLLELNFPLGEDDVRKVDSTFTDLEMKDAIQQMLNGKSPVEDGFTVESYKVFYDDLSSLFMDVLHQVICDKIFRPLFSPKLSELRVYHPLQPQLDKAIQRCAELSSQGRVDKKITEGTFSELYHLFKAGQREQ